MSPAKLACAERHDLETLLAQIERRRRSRSRRLTDPLLAAIVRREIKRRGPR